MAQLLNRGYRRKFFVKVVLIFDAAFSTLAIWSWLYRIPSAITVADCFAETS